MYSYSGIGSIERTLTLCCSRKNPYPPHGRTPEIPSGRGVLKVKILEAKYEAKLNFLGGGRVQNKKPAVGGVWIFSGTAHFSEDILTSDNNYGAFMSHSLRRCLH